MAIKLVEHLSELRGIPFPNEMSVFWEQMGNNSGIFSMEGLPPDALNFFNFMINYFFSSINGIYDDEINPDLYKNGDCKVLSLSSQFVPMDDTDRVLDKFVSLRDGLVRIIENTLLDASTVNGIRLSRVIVPDPLAYLGDVRDLRNEDFNNAIIGTSRVDFIFGEGVFPVSSKVQILRYGGLSAFMNDFSSNILYDFDGDISKLMEDSFYVFLRSEIIFRPQDDGLTLQ